MGFLKKTFIYLVLPLFINGCAPSLIKIDLKKDVNPHSQYGKSSQREFISDQSIDINLSEKWEASINGGFSSSSVTVSDSAVFVNDLSGRIYCFSLVSGKTLGILKYKGSIFTTPVIHKSLIIYAVVSDKENISTFYVYDFKSGKELSSKEIKGRITNQLVKTDDGVYGLSEEGRLFKFGFLGDLIWTFETRSYTHNSPASNSKVVVFGNDNGEIICIGNGNVLFSKDFNSILNFRKIIGVPFFGSAVIFENEIYIGNDDGNLYSINLTTGEIIWAFQTGASIKMEAVVNEEALFIGNLKGDFFKLSRLDGKQIWKTETNGLLNITPLLISEYLILPDTNKKVYFISKDNGEIVQTIPFDGRLKLSPVIKNNLLLFGYENGNVKAYEIKQK